jgi:hypothetical protein
MDARNFCSNASISFAIGALISSRRKDMCRNNTQFNPTEPYVEVFKLPGNLQKFNRSGLALLTIGFHLSYLAP